MRPLLSFFGLALKSIFISTCLIVLLSGQAALGQSAVSLKAVFSRPLIFGASVSAGYGTPGPGDVAGRMLKPRENITNIAKNGAQGRYFKNLNPQSISKYTVLIGVDFMFWDSALNDPTESIMALRHLVWSANKAGVPLILGDVPMLSPIFQREAVRVRINQEIHAQCRASRHCFVIGMEKLHRQAQNEGVAINGRIFHVRDLMAFDGLHLTALASHYIARLILGLLAGS